VRVTLNNISKAIKEKHGVDVSLFRGEGYHYFYSDLEHEGAVLSGMWSSSVLIYNLNMLTVDEWVEKFEELFEDDQNGTKITDLIEVKK